MQIEKRGPKKAKAVIRVVLAFAAVAIACITFVYRTGQPLHIKAAWVVVGFLAFCVLVMLVAIVFDRKAR